MGDTEGPKTQFRPVRQSHLLAGLKWFLPLAGHALWPPPTPHRGWSVWLTDYESDGLSLLKLGYKRPRDFSFSHPWTFCSGLSQLPCCHTDRPVWWRTRASGQRPSRKRRPPRVTREGLEADALVAVILWGDWAPLTAGSRPQERFMSQHYSAGPLANFSSWVTLRW